MLMYTQFHEFPEECQSAPDVFSCNINFIVCPREVEIVTGEGLNEQIESCLASDRLFPRGLSKCQGTAGTNEIIPQTLKSYYCILALH